MKFYEGDRVKLNGEIYTVRGSCDCGICRQDENVCLYFLSDNGDIQATGAELEPVEPKKIPVTEIDFLDAFQENFKRGI